MSVTEEKNMPLDYVFIDIYITGPYYYTILETEEYKMPLKNNMPFDYVFMGIYLTGSENHVDSAILRWSFGCY